MNRRNCVAAGILLAGFAAGGCSDVNDPPPFDPQTFQAAERQASIELKTPGKPALPTTLGTAPRRGPGSATTAPVVPPGFDTSAAVTPLTLREIIQRAVANNLNVKVAGYDPAINATRVIEEQAKFDPAFFVNTSYTRQDNQTAGIFLGDPTTGLSDISFKNASDVIEAETGIKQNLESGGQAQLKYSTAYNHLDPKQTVLNPYWENNLQLEITQPLLRSFGQNINQANITIAKLNQRISLLDFRKTLEDQISTIERTYWQLTEAVEEEKIDEELLSRTTRMVDILHARINQDVTIVQVSQARASEEARRATLVRARARVGDLSDQLKNLMNDPAWPVASATLLMPASAPLLEPLKFDLNEQISQGLEYRFELGQQLLRINSANVAAQVAKNGLLPQLNLQGSAGFQGLDSSFGDAFSNQMDFNHFSWAIGFQFQIPIGNREARAVWQRSLLQRASAVDQYRQLIDQVALDVKTATREVETTWNEIVTSRAARFAADQSLNAIQQREDAKEPLTPTFVQLKLDTQERLATAKISEAQAISNYNTALAQLEKAKGTLLRYNNVQMQEDKLPLLASPK